MAEFSSALLLTAFWLTALVVAMVFIIAVTQAFKAALRRKQPPPSGERRAAAFMPSEERGVGLEEMAAAIAAVTAVIDDTQSALPTAEVSAVAALPWKVASRFASLRTLPREETVKS